MTSAQANQTSFLQALVCYRPRNLGRHYTSMENVASSSSGIIAADNTQDILILENKETSPLPKATNKKRRLEEDISTELGDGIDGDTGVSSISSIAATTTTTVLSPTHTTSVQVSAPVDLHAKSFSEATSLPLAHTQIEEKRRQYPSFKETRLDMESTFTNSIPTSSIALRSIEEKDVNTRPLKKPRLDIESTATIPIPTSSITLRSTAPLAVVISDANITLQVDVFPKPSAFVVLPVELLSEILIYTGSPQYVLAVARTCKTLCQTLLSTNNQFIWREARRACPFNFADEPVYLPDPPKEFFGEAAYAAFVFDSGVCEACGKETNIMYVSFALRARLCKDTRCRNSPSTALGLTEGLDLSMAVVPVAESNACLGKVTDGSQLFFYPSLLGTEYCRASDWQNARAWVENTPRDDAFCKKFGRACSRKVRWMEFAVSLHKWGFARQAQYCVIRNFNETQSRIFADKFGWDHSDMINNTIYGLYHRRKRSILEKVNETDVRVMIDQIESQLLALSEKRGRHAVEVAHLKNRSDVEKHYNSIRSSKIHPFLPSLPTFRQLPIINLLQSASTIESITIAQTLQSNPLMRGLLSDQLKQWAETAKEDFAVLLGFPRKWKNASKNVLHPVERATARFQCIRCGAKAKSRGNTDDGCLDFAAACKHVCSIGQGRVLKGKKGKWNVSNFVKDEKAICALNKIIRTLNYSEDKAGALAMIALGLAVLCTSCHPPMVLDSRSVVGHCHRHDAMELSLALSVETITSYLGGYPFAFGLTEKLMGPEGLTVKGKNAIQSKNYGCRHCLRVKQVETAAAAATENEGGGGGGGEETGKRTPDPADPVQVKLSTTACRMHDLGFEGPKEKPPPLFNFNGMVSHLKAKHHIERIRDEDFLCYDAIKL